MCIRRIFLEGDTDMKKKIIVDSSCCMMSIENLAEGIEFVKAPLKIMVGDKEFVDDENLDVANMIDEMYAYPGKTSSACPSPEEYAAHFREADECYVVTIISTLSGSYNAAQQAANDFMEENPGKKAYIFDSLAAGPQQAMLCDKIAELIAAGYDFDTIVEKARDYHNHTHILFCLESMTNLARNGRVNPTVAKIANAIGIRVCGDVKAGEIIPVHKPRGAKKAMSVLVDMLGERGYKDGMLIRVAHCFGEENANAFKAAVLAKYPNANFVIEHTTGLCSFYAEAGGLMIGFEGGYNTNNNNNEH